MVAVITIDDVEDARRRVAPVLRPTPVEQSDTLSRRCGKPVLLKPEYRQRTGSFKIRGAYNFISRLPSGGAVVAASAGNHAQGVALAASLSGLQATIFMPADAALPKVEATRSYGADVRLVGDVVDDCFVEAKRYADEVGAVYVPPFDDPLVIAGQGTLGLEIAEEAPDLAAVTVPVGGGGLLSGVATALAHRRPDVQVWGVEAEGAASMVASLAAGRPVAVDEPLTMADGIAVKTPSALTVEHVAAHAAGVVTVTEEEISTALLLLLERAKAVVEPAGAVALAAILAGKVEADGPVLAVLSGGNVDPLLLIKLIEHGLSVSGRYLRLRITLVDRPGTLAEVTAAVAALGLNVLEVEHHRAGVNLAVGQTEVLFTVETRDPEHRDQILAALRAKGFTVELLG